MNEKKRGGVRGLFAGRKLFVASAIAALAVICVALFIGLGGKGNKAEYRTESVTKGDIQQTITATGTVNAVTTVLVGTQVSGTIKTLFVDFNSRVKKGQIIAQIDPSTFESQVQQAQANLLAAQANLDKSNSALVDATRTYERNKELFAKNLIPRSDLDTAETNYESAKAQVGSAKAQIEQTKASLDYAKQNLAYTKILSPVDGIVISRNVDVGQTVAASFQTPTLFTIAEDLTKMQIDTNVAESDIGVVKVGQEVEFTVDAYPDTTFKGNVWQIRKAPITVQNVVTYDVVIQVGNKDLRLMPGMTANVSIIITTRQDVLRITNAALRFRMGERPSGAGGAGSGEKKGPAVWVLENGKPRRVQITPGISDGSFTEILAGDVKEGQQLIVESLKKGKTASGPAGPRMF
ncbi:MAG TPA: efflux RND transporter periplasmic adaptor subunit [Nitrospirota bacterium]|nr:efflux RND transporter periplasmic adaptor subunit [Nitrospirota bacterium]